MRLAKIRLAGFKSFVDPTTFVLKRNMVGIVGPNGCGKSNIIDAVRWVMGESSARYLRGESMADVIFSGARNRKPVGKASIELVFDNRDGSLGGQWAQYAEIAVRRELTREGGSTYFLNNAKCRRRDIADVFMGTGLGPRSYAIIEQGMISRFVEAKPDELRLFIEEAAGISRYKDRRKETATRIKHTRENLERLEDLREELGKQLARLQRQAKAAAQYKEYKTEERQQKATLLSLKWQAQQTVLDDLVMQMNQAEDHWRQAGSRQYDLDEALESDRETLHKASENTNEVQGQLYGIAADIARVEQEIRHIEELEARQQRDKDNLLATINATGHQLDSDRQRLLSLHSLIEELQPQAEAAAEQMFGEQEQLRQTEDNLAHWQDEWEAFSRQLNGLDQQANVEKARLEHLQRNAQQLAERRQRLSSELAELQPAPVADQLAQDEHAQLRLQQEHEQDQLQLEQLTEHLEQLRDEQSQLQQTHAEQQKQLHSNQGRLASLHTLQQAALQEGGKHAKQWLDVHGLSDAPRVLQQLKVDAGWETAVETVLGDALEAVLTDQPSEWLQALQALQGGRMQLMAEHSEQVMLDSESLAAQVQGPLAVVHRLRSVLCAADAVAALAMVDQLSPGQSVICPDGLWLGSGWVRVQKQQAVSHGAIARERELQALQQTLDELTATQQNTSEQLQTLKTQLREGEQQREQLRHAVNQQHRQLAELNAQIKTRRERLQQIEQRRDRLVAEMEDLAEHQAEEQTQAEQSRVKLETAGEQLAALTAERRQRLDQRDGWQVERERSQQRLRHAQESQHQAALQLETRRSEVQALTDAIERLTEQLAQQQSNLAQLGNQQAQPESLPDKQDQLQDLRSRQVAIEQALRLARETQIRLEDRIREFQQQRLQAEQSVNDARNGLEKLRLQQQEAGVRQQTVVEQLSETGYEPQTVLAQLGDNAEQASVEKRLTELAHKIGRLGSINLAAIDEYQEQSERKEYLDAQHEDLSSALETLEAAIRKIDKETRARFKETFEQVNEGLQDLFPRLFGGGQAKLDLTDPDLLEAGVAIMARPPGKRNSTIALLSGGEKALTAIALVFAIFKLNPAPFCMLDEVDAPLDEANVGRYIRMVSEMSAHLQFVFITHNKTTMEHAQDLIGVTMHEPGVSRLVSVDVDAAVQMVNS